MFVQVLFALSLISMSSCGASQSSPISPKEYQKKIGQGFSTNYFKTKDPMSKYSDKNIDDVKAKGFRNLRIRCDSHFTDQDKSFLKKLGDVVDKCLKVGVAPIISWINHTAEAYATEYRRKKYVAWWTAVANHLKDKDYLLSFNLFTELGVDVCGHPKSPECANSLRINTTKYNQWTSDVVKAIRATGGNNTKRILILASPKKTGAGLHLINSTIFKHDDYMMAEFHLYASGPTKNKGTPKYWKGNGAGEKGENNVHAALEEAKRFTDKYKIETYFGAWMPTDNKDGSLKEREVKNFAKYFVQTLKKEGIPWSLNVLDRYYDTKKGKWIKGKQNIKGTKINMAKVLQTITDAMKSE